MSNLKASVVIGILSSFIAALAFFSGTIAVFDSVCALVLGFKSPVSAPPISLFFAVLLAFGVLVKDSDKAFASLPSAPVVE